MRFIAVQLSHIDLDDDTYSLLPPCCSAEPAAALIESIRCFGVLHPPIIKEREGGAFVVVAGRKRLRILKKQGAGSSCHCLMAPTDTPEANTLDLCLEEALLHGPLSPVQRATFFTKALQWHAAEELAVRVLPRLGLSPSPYLVRRDLPLLDLEEPLLVALHQGTLEEKVALELTGLSFGDRLALFAVISDLHLSVGNQKKFLTACRELATRNNITIRALLSAAAVDAIIHHEEANPPQKTAKLMKWLEGERFPRLAAAEKEFHHFVAGFALPPGVRLEHSPSFEKDEVILTLPCVNRAHFQTIWQRITDLVPARAVQESLP